MSGYDLLKPKAVVNFSVYPSAILAANFTSVRVEAIIDAETARLLGFDPWSMHVNVYPTLPEGVPDDPNDYLFVRVKFNSGETTILGIPWIREDSIEQVSYTTISLKIPNVGPGDVDKVVKALSANGYSASDVKLI
jgi:hypothetical protein